MTQNRLGTLTLVTPPSSIQSDNESFCIVNFKDEDKDKFANYLNEYKPDDDLTIYVVDSNNSEFTLDWLIDVIEKSNNVIVKASQGYKFSNKSTEFSEFKKVKQLETFLNARR